MPFPEIKQRIIYKKNPLDQVICQLRFPAILKISAEIPFEFQEKIREQFPEFSELSELSINIPNAENQIPAEILKSAHRSSNNRNYEFFSEDKQWKINLTNNFFALSSFNYKNWEEFSDRLKLPFAAFLDIYKPKRFSRIGLRYIDVIKRSKLGLEKIEWDDLLKPYFLGVLASPEGKNVQSFENRYEIRLSDNESTVNLVTRLVKDSKDNEECFMIDSDFFSVINTDISEVPEKLCYFNKRASRLLQWCISEKLHNAMEPKNYDEYK
ncbi:MAG: TIGR04255 family protein [Bacteroidetes bacterium]|nr:TIGR04255 family protein [Bacteroidota bacterium]